VPHADRIVIIGGGSLRCATPVLSGLFSFPPPTGFELRLCDPHAEALDLFAKVAEVLAEDSATDVSIRTSDSLDELMPGATCVILGFGLGRSKELWERWMREAGVADPGSRPALLARAVLLSPVFERVNRHLESFAERPMMVNLVRPIEFSSAMLRGPAHHLEWPSPLPDWERVPAAHSALRLVMRDSYASHSIHEFSETPFTECFGGRAKEEDRYEPGAAKIWLSELEAEFPDTVHMLFERTT
jgi:hypothetical protein